MASSEKIVMHLLTYVFNDYDCYYASVLENENPHLRSVPLGVQQKGILATCNYKARAMGVKKLQPIAQAKRACSNLVIVNGEDLTKYVLIPPRHISETRSESDKIFLISRFREVSKTIWLFVRSLSWGNLTERLGLDEIFVDVTEIVAYNLERLQTQYPVPSPSCSGHSFFRLSRSDPSAGFEFVWSDLPGHPYPSGRPLEFNGPNVLHRRLILAAHLANYIRMQILERFNHTCSAGISTTKLSAKLVGAANKPNSQTTLVPEFFQEFFNAHEIGQIPGIGHRIAQKLRDVCHGRSPTPAETITMPRECNNENNVTVEAALNILTRGKIETVLGVPSGTNTGRKIWNLLRGIDESPVVAAPVYPTQISIEDTFRPGSITTFAQLTKVLHRLLTKLLQRMYSELTIPSVSSQKKWIVSPRNFRMSVRLHDRVQNFSRCSRSSAFPGYTFSPTTSLERIAERLIDDIALGLFRKLCTERHWDLQLLNVAAVNMVGEGTEKGDIGYIFKNLITENGLNEAVSVSNSGTNANNNNSEERELDGKFVDEEFYEDDEDEDEDSGQSVVCEVCRVAVPIFAVDAHRRFHLRSR
ncbi:hypothetical protein EDC01DRAFT_628578 [Geopyxis carbonaria]|nr:hypothetical protein EDC01DRAFT_628578 [Geopyxis carbonaria]